MSESIDTNETEAEFTIQRTFSTSRERLWDAWTDPDFAARWWHPRGVSTSRESVMIDPRVGGTYEYTMTNDANGEEYPTGGVYLEVVEPERLVFTWGTPGNEDAPVITIDLKEVDDGTEMTFHIRGVAGKPGDGYIYDGWDEAIQILDEELAAQSSSSL